MLVGITPAKAATYVAYNCGCDPNASSGTGIVEPHQCKCDNDYTLGKLGTKEFRVSCTNGNAVAVRTELCVTGRGKNTTCTIELDGWTSDVSKSCTNWSLLNTDTVTVTTYCNADDWTVDWHCK